MTVVFEREESEYMQMDIVNKIRAKGYSLGVE